MLLQIRRSSRAKDAVWQLPLAPKPETVPAFTTGLAVSPGSPPHYQNQPGKWGADLRVYFNDPGMAVTLAAKGVHVEYPRKHYKSGDYRYRFNDNKLWWKLVEEYGLRLGPN